MKRKPGPKPKPASDHSARVLVTMPQECDAIAIELGDGCRSRGVQIALRAAKRLMEMETEAQTQLTNEVQT